MNTAIIVAAGEGRRFGGLKPKQFIELHGKPLILHTLEKFDACDAVDEIIVVLSEGGRSVFGARHIADQISTLRAVVTGGATRAESAKRGFDAIDSGDAGIVIVHDGARPLVTVDEITRTVKQAETTGAACLVAEVTDTVKSVAGNHIERTLDRDKLRRALTPQAFNYHVLLRAYEGADLSDAVTDECYLVERLGHPISFVEGSPFNIKVTRPEDLLIAELLLERS